jgi:polyphosphate:AMP phosphotransferase
MLEKIDLKAKVSKAEFKSESEELELRLGRLQRQARKLGIPVIVAFEGWEGAGKGTQINRLIHCLDPRGFAVYSIQDPSPDEAMRPFLWRFWNKTPAKGGIAVFDRSWCQSVLLEQDRKKVKGDHLAEAFADIESFERQLTTGGTLIVKFFLHISRSEQKKRLKNLASNEATSWRVTGADRKQNKHYENYAAAAEDMLARTNWEFSPWTVIPAHDERYACLAIGRVVAVAMEERIRLATQKADPKPAFEVSNEGQDPAGNNVLAKIDLSLALGRKEYKRRLDAGQERLRLLEHEIYMRRIPVVIAYEGSDAGGKGGNIRRLTRELDPRGYEVVPVAAPNDLERAHHYLWRFWNCLPKAGHMTIFDRSWYGRVLVERVEGFCSEADWKRAYEEINAFERHLTNFGVVLVKFWLQIDQAEQLRRFENRQKTESKQWKITDEDWRNREKWPEYEGAVNEMLTRTSTLYAPWTVVEGNCKWHARVKCLETVAEAIEKAL